jgi:hypothetical protein
VISRYHDKWGALVRDYQCLEVKITNVIRSMVNNVPPRRSSSFRELLYLDRLLTGSKPANAET